MNDELATLEAQCESATSPEAYTLALLALTEYLETRDPARAVILSDQVIRLAKESGDSRAALRGYLHLAKGQESLGEYSVAADHALRALDMAREQGNISGEVRAIMLLGNAHFYAGDSGQALNHYMTALKLNDSLGDGRRASSLLTNLAIVIDSTGDHEEALRTYNQSIEAGRQAGVPEIEIANTYHNMACTYMEMRQFDKVFEMEHLALAVFEPEKSYIDMTLAWDAIGDANRELGNFPNSLAAYEKATATAQASQSPYFVAFIQQQMARVYLAQGNYAQSLRMLRTALEYMQHGEKPDRRQIHDILAQVYEAMGDHYHAFEHLKACHTLQKEIHNDRSDMRQRLLKTLFQVESMQFERELYRVRSEALEREMSLREEREQERIAAGVERERLHALQSLFSGSYHDLISPMTAIQTTGRLIADFSKHDPKLVERALRIVASADELHAKLENMFLIARLDSDAPDMFSFAPCSVGELAHRALQDVRASGPDQARLVVQASDPTLKVMADPQLFVRALANLLDNALRYSPADAPVRLEMQPAAPDSTPPLITFTVIDTGSGIPEAELPSIFQRTYRGQMHRPDGHSTGLGLSIARAIVEKHSGRIEVETQPGEGSVFRILVPLYDETAASSQALQSQPVDTENHGTPL